MAANIKLYGGIMKKLFLILTILIILFGCEDATEDNTPEIPDPPVIDPPVIDPPIEPDSSPVIFSLYDGEKMMYYDGNEIVIAYYGNVNTAGSQTRSIDDVLYHFNEYGDPVLSEWLPVIPDAIISKPNQPQSSGQSRAIAYQDEVWILEDIDPATALSLGAQYKHYTNIYHNLDIEGLWYFNDWEVKEVISPLSGAIIAIDTLNGYHNLTGQEVIYRALNNGLMIHNFNINTKTANIKTDTGNYNISWTFNFFNSAKWQLADGIWYSHNGYIWDSVNDLQEQSTAMWDWNQYPYPVQDIYGEAPVLIPAGVVKENNIEVIYWIECNTGTLIRYIPGIDDIGIFPQIYVGDGYRMTGISKSKYLEPEIADGNLYFHDSGSIKKYNFNTSIVSVFSGDMELDLW